jgi:hypothetical protein
VYARSPSAGAREASERWYAEPQAAMGPTFEVSLSTTAMRQRLL